MDEPEPDPVVLPIEDSLDLHPFAPRDVQLTLIGTPDATKI